MSDKPAFDPNAPFTTSQSGEVVKPAFNPNAAFSTSPPDELPDVGAPAIDDGGQFSTGIPALNEEVERVAKSANKNLIEPIEHPIDTISGLAGLGAGAVQYAGMGALGSDYKPYIDALARDYLKTYSSAAGFKDALINDPVRVGMDASLGIGLLGKIGRIGRAGSAARVAAPTTAELFDSAEGHYSAMHGYGLSVDPDVLERAGINVTQDLKNQGFYPTIAPKTFGMIDELYNPDGGSFSTQQVESIRRALGKISGDATDQAAARQVIDAIDDTMTNLRPQDAIANGKFAPHVAQEAAAARGDYAAAKRAEAVETARNKAELQTASTGSGANIDNATRQRFRAILNSRSARRGFSQDELDAMEQIVRGTTTGNAARLVGKLAPSGIVSGGLSAALGHAVGHTLGVPALGLVAKTAADAITGGGVSKLSEQVRLRSPLARQIGATAAPSRRVPNTMQLRRIGNMSNQNPYEANP